MVRFRNVLIGIAASLTACSATRPPKFADRPAVTTVADASPSPVPERIRLADSVFFTDTYVRRPLIQALELERVPEAGDVNALDEVPTSTWYRPPPSGMKRLARAYRVDGPPTLPLRVVTRKTSLGRGGLSIVDSRGLAYELFRDPKTAPATTTAAAAIASRLVRAAGYQTPEAWVRELNEPPKPGWNRVVAIRWPIGIDLGPAPADTTRSGDPNDRVPHRDRRTLRALAVLGAWLDARTLGIRSTRDAYVGEPGRGHVEHYLVGFNRWLGAWRAPGSRRDYAVGEVRGGIVKNLFTLGLTPENEPGIRSLTAMSDQLDVAGYRTRHPYEPISRALPQDNYWGAKAIGAIRPEAIEWAVRAGHLSADARKKIAITLLIRRRQVMRHWFAQVSPCEPVRVLDRSLVLLDEAIHHGVESASRARYAISFLDEAGDRLVPDESVRLRGEVFTVQIPDRALEEPYVVVRLRAVRAQRAAPRAAEIHVVTTDEVRIVGVRH